MNELMGKSNKETEPLVCLLYEKAAGLGIVISVVSRRHPLVLGPLNE
jgi:hypothetical protein